MSTNSFCADLNSSEGQEWLSSVKRVLKDKDFDSLKTDTLDEIKLEPLYADNLKTDPIIGRELGTPWQIVQRFDSGSVSMINQELKLANSSGCNYFDFVLPDAPIAYSRGIQIGKVQEIPKLFEGIEIAELVVRITGSLDAIPFVAAVHEYADKINVKSPDLSLEQSFDLTLSNYGCVRREEAEFRVQHLHDQLKTLNSLNEKCKLVSADARIWHNAGANNIVELALCISQFVENMRLCEKNEIGPQDFLNRMTISLATGVNQFANIAKFRSIRVLITSVIEHCKLNPVHIPIHAESSWRMMTIHDPWVNLLRTTIACFSAGIGGAESISILPFSYVIGNSSLANRLTRTTQKILIEESNLGIVSDPAAGSGVIENLTQNYCEQAWEMFQKIEQLGGLFKASEVGFIQETIKTTEQQRSENVQTGQLVITGINSFPNISEELPKIEKVTLQPAEKVSPRTQNISKNAGNWYELVVKNINETGVIPSSVESIQQPAADKLLSFSRMSEPFEELRNKAKLLTSGDHKPSIFVAGLGTPAQFTKGVTFAKSFFESAGITAFGNQTSQSISDLVKSILSDKFQLVCLCSNGAGFKEYGAELTSSLNKSNIKNFYIVGQQSELPTDLINLSNFNFIYQGCNMLSILNDALEVFNNKKKFKIWIALEVYHA